MQSSLRNRSEISKGRTVYLPLSCEILKLYWYKACYSTGKEICLWKWICIQAAYSVHGLLDIPYSYVRFPFVGQKGEAIHMHTPNRGIYSPCLLLTIVIATSPIDGRDTVSARYTYNNKTSEDGGISVHFKIIKVHTSIWDDLQTIRNFRIIIFFGSSKTIFHKNILKTS